MKKKIVTLLLAVILAFTAASFAACVKDQPADTSAKSVKFILADKELTVLKSWDIDTDSAYLEGVINEINIDLNDGVSFELTDSSYGKYVATFTYQGSVYCNAAENEYVACYTSIDEALYITPGMTLAVGGIQYNYNGLGISSMPAQNGETYVFVIEGF
jgi:hypothetical protein